MTAPEFHIYTERECIELAICSDCAAWYFEDVPPPCDCTLGPESHGMCGCDANAVRQGPGAGWLDIVPSDYDAEDRRERDASVRSVNTRRLPGSRG